MLADNRHAKMNMPVLFRTSLATTVLVDVKVRTLLDMQQQANQLQEIQFVFNAQHDCTAGNCGIEICDKIVMQERLPVQRRLPTLVHKNDTQFIINMHALHNAQLLRQCLPRALTKPRHKHTDRSALHAQLASLAHTTRETKRGQTAEKRAAAAAATAAMQEMDQSTGGAATGTGE